MMYYREHKIAITINNRIYIYTTKKYIELWCFKIETKMPKIILWENQYYEHYKFHRMQEKWPTGLVLDLEEHESVLNLKM